MLKWFVAILATVFVFLTANMVHAESSKEVPKGVIFNRRIPHLA